MQSELSVYKNQKEKKKEKGKNLAEHLVIAVSFILTAKELSYSQDLFLFFSLILLLFSFVDVGMFSSLWWNMGNIRLERGSFVCYKGVLCQSMYIHKTQIPHFKISWFDFYPKTCRKVSFRQIYYYSLICLKHWFVLLIHIGFLCPTLLLVCCGQPSSCCWD